MREKKLVWVYISMFLKWQTDQCYWLDLLIFCSWSNVGYWGCWQNSQGLSGVNTLFDFNAIYFVWGQSLLCQDIYARRSTKQFFVIFDLNVWLGTGPHYAVPELLQTGNFSSQMRARSLSLSVDWVDKSQHESHTAKAQTVPFFYKFAAHRLVLQGIRDC